MAAATMERPPQARRTLRPDRNEQAKATHLNDDVPQTNLVGDQLLRHMTVAIEDEQEPPLGVEDKQQIPEVEDEQDHHPEDENEQQTPEVDDEQQCHPEDEDEQLYHPEEVRV